MSGRKNTIMIFGLVLSVSLMACAVSVAVASYHYNRLQFDILNTICGKVAEQKPETQTIISAALKEYTVGIVDGTGKNDILSTLGYRRSDFSGSSYGQSLLLVMTGFLSGVSLFAFTFLYRNKTEAMRIQALTDYLEQGKYRQGGSSLCLRGGRVFKTGR